MNTLIQHRGPDDEGYCLVEKGDPLFFKGNDSVQHLSAIDHILNCNENFSIAMGHRRLSIVDPSINGHQPLYDANNGYVLIYNGEIYNYAFLRKKFIRMGYMFKTQTDSEVVLAAYHFYKEEALDYLEGMFAFVLLDTASSKLLIARDRFGIKPLYYRHTENNFSIASEIKQFTVLEDWKAVANKERVSEFLESGHQDHTHETMFSGVFQVPAGHYIYENLASLQHDIFQIQQYYRMRPQKVPRSMSTASTIFKAFFIDSVKAHTPKNLPLGLGLSGGLDSSSLLGCLIHNNIKNITTFSSISRHKHESEEHYIDHMVNEYPDIPNIKIFPQTSPSLKSLKELTWFHDEPLYSLSIFAESSVFEHMKKEGIKVSLEGHGADEILNGYYEDIQNYGEILWRQKKFLRLFRFVFLLCWKHAYLIQYVLKKLWRKFFLKKIIHLSDHPCSSSKIKIDKFQSSLYKQLHWTDRNSMRSSVEARVPFLAKDMVEFSTSTPDHFKFKNGFTKFLLRKAMKSHLPEVILNRKRKLGFPLNVSSVLLEHKFTLLKALHKLSRMRLLQQHPKFNDIDYLIKNENITLLWRIFAVYLWTKCFEVTS